MAVRRVVLVVLDSVGIGVQPEAERDPADAGSNTLANTARAVGGLALPNLARLGLGRLIDAPGLTPVSQPLGAFGRLTTRGPGKETLSGHWEMMGCIAPRPFRTFPHGFPPEVIRPFEAAAGRPVLGNRPASGTVIIEELGVEHMASGRPIVYTSADSVFQIAAHEEVVPLEELYRLCQAAREILQGDYLVGRVIARPFVGRPGAFQRTVNRRDFAVEPFTPTVLDHLADAGIPVHAIGKIWDIFSGRGISSHVHTQDNRDGMARTLEAMAERPEGLIFTNLVDFDSQFGHRNDPEGYARALREVDAWLPEWLAALRPGDVGILTADHGNDPTTPSTDHSREYVPALLFGPEVGAGVNLGTRPTLADLGRTVAEALGVQGPPVGESFWPCVAQR